MLKPGCLKSQSAGRSVTLETEASRGIYTSLTMKKSDGHEMAHILSSFVEKRPALQVTNRWVGK